MKAPHTPAPWIVDDKHVHSELPVYRDARLLEDYSDIVCEVNTDSRESGLLTETDKANLRLIAAAPDLLGALEDMVKSSDKGFTLPWGTIRVAISKAKGTP